MSKTKDLAKGFLRSAKEKSAAQKGLAPTQVNPINVFDRMFEVKELSENDSNAIDMLIVDNYQSELIDESKVEADMIGLKKITKEIKAIGRQSTILLGERIHKAKQLLQNYKDRTFRDWLRIAIGSVATGYSILSYYELYVKLPNEQLKSKLKEIPNKAAYILAQREAPFDEKVKIIEDHSTDKSSDIINLIKGKFPSKDISPKTENDRLICSIERSAAILLKNQKDLKISDIERIKMLITSFKQMIECV
ncbi:MAG: hypothetical protein COT84_05630 [Chlamydiae bacterium CG10_big_fil_rev_8_21_14_0_10_35_9]|nr:MAG: hypothetical protein COT84_05630 [Chlamydiae bacterium CG10_big_fil_rev_8_21_14_0_10_35_9]